MALSYVDRLKRVVRRVMASVWYAELSPAVVTLDRGDGTVDVKLTGQRFKGDLSNVTVATPGGVASEIAVGTKCLVSYTDRRQASVVEWEFQAESATLTFAGDAGGAARVARVGDLVEVLVSPADTVVGALIVPSPAAQAIIQTGVPTLPPATPVVLSGIVFAGAVSGNICMGSNTIKG